MFSHSAPASTLAAAVAGIVSAAMPLSNYNPPQTGEQWQELGRVVVEAASDASRLQHAEVVGGGATECEPYGTPDAIHVGERAERAQRCDGRACLHIAEDDWIANVARRQRQAAAAKSAPYFRSAGDSQSNRSKRS